MTRFLRSDLRVSYSFRVYRTDQPVHLKWAKSLKNIAALQKYFFLRFSFSYVQNIRQYSMQYILK